MKNDCDVASCSRFRRGRVDCLRIFPVRSIRKSNDHFSKGKKFTSTKMKQSFNLKKGNVGVNLMLRAAELREPPPRLQVQFCL